MGPQEKLELDIRDFWRIHDGLEAYAGLDTKGVMERLDAHKEDTFCEIRPASGRGKLYCTRDGFEAIFELAGRHVNSLPVPNDYSVNEVAKEIRKYIAQAIIEQKADEPALAWVLAKAIAEVETGHIERTYHFPCVLVSCRKPPQFRVGPVTFTTAETFPTAMANVFRQSSERRPDSPERLEGFKNHVAEYGWVASVTIPPCAEESATDRAEVTIATAINLLRLFLGIPHARDIRIAHAPQKPSNMEYGVEEKGELHLIFSRTPPGAMVEDDWHVAMDKFRDFWERGAHLLGTAVAGRRSEIANRLIDAVRWFGEAAFETAPGTQIAKFVFALERLTTTQQFGTHAFCARVALLVASQSDADFEQCYWDAYTVYSSRSRVAHGGISAKTSSFGKTLRLAHDVTRKALVRGLGVHCFLDDSGRSSTLADLHNFFEEWQSKKAVILEKLRHEVWLKRKLERKIGS
jgi:hypothetical protein